MTGNVFVEVPDALNKGEDSDSTVTRCFRLLPFRMCLGVASSNEDEDEPVATWKPSSPLSKGDDGEEDGGGERKKLNTSSISGDVVAQEVSLSDDGSEVRDGPTPVAEACMAVCRCCEKQISRNWRFCAHCGMYIENTTRTAVVIYDPAEQDTRGKKKLDPIDKPKSTFLTALDTPVEDKEETTSRFDSPEETIGCDSPELVKFDSPELVKFDSPEVKVVMNEEESEDVVEESKQLVNLSDSFDSFDAVQDGLIDELE